MGEIGRTKRLAVVYCATAAWAFSFGVGAPLASLWLEQAGASSGVIGWNHTAYYLGMALAALAAPALMRRWGYRAATLGMLASAATVAAFPWVDGFTTWLIMRLLNGIAGALSVIPLETYVNRHVSPAGRGRALGLFALALTLGYGLGNGIGLAAFPVLRGLAFALGGLAALAAGGAICLEAWENPLEEANESAAVRFTWRRDFLSFGSAWSQGFLEGGMIAFMAIYLLGLGYSEGDASWMIASTMLGILLFQLPVAWLADRVGRKRVLLGSYGLTLMVLGLVPLAGNSAWLPGLLIVVGGCSAAFYPLGLALLGEKLPAHALAKINAWYLSAECAGCICGPVILGYAMEAGGRAALFWVSQAGLAVILVMWSLTQLLQPGEETQGLIPCNGLRANRAA